MEKKLLLAAALSLAVLLLWEKLVPKPAASPEKLAQTAATAPTKAPEASASPPEPARALPAPVAGATESLTTLEDGLVRATFSNRGATMTSLLLLRHTDEKRKPLELVRSLPAPAPRPL